MAFSGFDISVKYTQCSARGLSELPSPGEERCGSRLECVWYSICQCVKQVGFGKQQQRKRERESIRRIAVCSAVPSLCSRETRPWLKTILQIVVLSLILCSDSDLLRHLRYSGWGTNIVGLSAWTSVRLRTQQQLIFPPQFEAGPARLRTIMDQPNFFGVASFVAKCLARFLWFF
jgi:hypothetical protein